MAKEREKYIQRLSVSQKQRLAIIIDKILAGDIQDLDIKKLDGIVDTRRCRVGDLRIVYTMDPDGYTILRIGPRGDVYKS